MVPDGAAIPDLDLAMTGRQLQDQGVNCREIWGTKSNGGAGKMFAKWPPGETLIQVECIAHGFDPLLNPKKYMSRFISWTMIRLCLILTGTTNYLATGYGQNRLISSWPLTSSRLPVL